MAFYSVYPSDFMFRPAFGNAGKNEDMMKCSEVLKKDKDFRSVYKEGRSRSNKYLVMYVKENGTDKNRIGISVSRKIGNSVERHHLTRLIRESYRSLEDRFLKGYDIIVIARAGAKDKKFSDIENALAHLEKLHGIYGEKTYGTQDSCSFRHDKK